MTEMEKFRNLPQTERQEKIRERFDLTDSDIENLKKGGLDLETADKLVENSVGIFSLPLGIATNFRMNGRDYLIPMVIEEPSVIAAASKAAKIFKENGGIITSSDKSVATGQIQLILKEGEIPSQVVGKIEEHRNEIITIANESIPNLVARGGGVKNIETRIIGSENTNPQVILHIYIDTKDAMGANITNTVCEKIAPAVAMQTGTKIGLKILSNLTDKRLAKASVSLMLPKEIAVRIVDAQKLAESDPYRAATHNKGIFNGIDSVVIATGNDWRAIEAGGHAYAARSGKYSPLTTWEIRNERLEGSIELPIQVGIVGGLTELQPVAKVSLKILRVGSARELSEVMAALGLAQNFAALYALVTTGIQEGHMKLHRKRVSI